MLEVGEYMITAGLGVIIGWPRVARCDGASLGVQGADFNVPECAPLVGAGAPLGGLVDGADGSGVAHYKGRASDHKGLIDGQQRVFDPCMHVVYVAVAVRSAGQSGRVCARL